MTKKIQTVTSESFTNEFFIWWSGDAEAIRWSLPMFALRVRRPFDSLINGSTLLPFTCRTFSRKV